MLEETPVLYLNLSKN